MDANILLWIQSNLRSPLLTPVFKTITAAGNAGILWIILSVTLLLIKKTRKRGVLCCCSLVSSFAVNNLIIKNLVNRIRPYEAISNLHILIAKPMDASFPSGHTASSFAVASVIFLTCKKRYGIAALIMAALIAFSRLYVGVHYPTDVLFGAFSGALIGSITVAISKHIDSKKNLIK